MANSSKREKVIRVMNGVVAGTSTQTSSAIDTAGYEGVKIYTALGAITSGSATTVKVQQSSDDGADSYADLTGSSIAFADTDDNKVSVHDIYRPQERYLKVVVTRATQNAVIDGIVAVLYGGRKQPTTDDTSVTSREVWVSPAEGTA